MATAYPWTVQWIKDVYLFGVDLTDDANRPYPDSMLEQSMAAAVGTLAMKLDISMRRKVVRERHDFSQAQWGDWALLVLDERPIKRVRGLRMMFGPTEVYDVPASWLTVPIPEAGHVQIVPGSSDVINSALGQMMFAGRWAWTLFETLPGWFEVEYEVGYDVPFATSLASTMPGWYPRGNDYGFNGRLGITIESQPAPDEGDPVPEYVATITGKDIAGVATVEDVTLVPGSRVWSVAGWSEITSVTWTALEGDLRFEGNLPDATNAGAYEPMPAVLLDVAGKLASTYPFNTAGDLIAGAGIASKSTGTDGLSQSISTTASATNAGYGARLIQYEKEVRKALVDLRRYYHGMSLRMV